MFAINSGLKQGGVLSSFLFIDELISECVRFNIGKSNTCIIVYADDIILISSVDAHLQILLDECAE